MQYLLSWTQKKDGAVVSGGDDFAYGKTAKDAIKNYLISDEYSEAPVVTENEYSNRETVKNDNGEAIGYSVELDDGSTVCAIIYGLRCTEYCTLRAYDITL